MSRIQHSAIATVTIFTFCFVIDFVSTLLQAWRAAASQSKSQPEPEPIPQYASLDWVKPKEVQDLTEEINVIELAKAQFPKPQPVINTLPQTPEASALEEWLSVVPSPYATPKADYSTLASLTMKKLRQEAKIRNVRNASAMVKKDLIAAILAA